MKVALIGASGMVGSRILAELSHRGHSVTAIARDVARIAALSGVTPTQGDAHDADALAERLKGADAVVSAVHFTASDPAKLLAAVRASGVRRYVVVGGAGGLQVAPGVRLIDTPQFPEMYRKEAEGGVAFHELLKTADDLDWTFVAPSAEILPGERTGTFRLGDDDLLIGPQGSKISCEDFALALVDELETPRHVRARFTVGY